MNCAQCGESIKKSVGAVNRALKIGSPMYCNKTCAGLGRRLKNPPTDSGRKEAKRIYDERYRADRADELKAKKREYFKRTYDPVKAAEERKKRMPKHVEYCRRPEYRKWKMEYDRQYTARKNFGEFADAFLLLQDIENEVAALATRYEIYSANGTLNKAQTRRRSL